MKLFIVVKDETDYNGERIYPKVFTNREDAETYCTQEKQAAIDYINISRELYPDRMIGWWVPDFFVEESEIAVLDMVSAVQNEGFELR